MVIKIKISDIAKDFGKQSKEIIGILDTYCEGPARKPATALTEQELNVLFDKLTQVNSVSDFGSYFAQKKTKSQDKKPAFASASTEQ